MNEARYEIRTSAEFLRSQRQRLLGVAQTALVGHPRSSQHLTQLQLALVQHP